ncbi:MAG: hypothetical protein ACREQ5_08290, partial [Candidatus Dormibacteria bacterium]
MDIQISVEELRKRKVFIATPMYGGQCTGLFMKSCLDLQGMLAGHGVESRFSFIFTESLITRARNYLCDEFIRSNFTHMLFIDADINFAANDIMALLAMDREIIGAGYPKKCLHADAQIQTENGPRTIRQIVEGGYKGKVRTLDATGQEIWRHVVNHFVEPNLDKKWVAVRTSKQRWRKPLIATTDHKLACVADIMDPQVSWIEAKDMRGNHLVERVSNQSINHHNALYNAEQLSVALGTALGDGHHGPKQKAYEAYKHEILGGAYYNNAQTKHLRTMLYP